MFFFQCCVPEARGLREFVSRAPVNGTRLHCTMIRHDDEHISSGACYTLYLEYLGGLVPLLKGKRTSKIRPEFVIFDPQVDGWYICENEIKFQFGELIFNFQCFRQAIKWKLPVLILK